MLKIIITKVNNNFIEKPSKKGSWVTFLRLCLNSFCNVFHKSLRHKDLCYWDALYDTLA